MIIHPTGDHALTASSKYSFTSLTHDSSRLYGSHLVPMRGSKSLKMIQSEDPGKNAGGRSSNPRTDDWLDILEH